MDKRTHLGMAGHFAAMAEFLYRGYNVAVPAVDIGDDVYVVEDEQGTMWRLQVKTSDTVLRQGDGARTHQFSLSRKQLKLVKSNELYFMFIVRWSERWRFVLISRQDLDELRTSFETQPSGKAGRPPKASGGASDQLGLSITWSDNDARASNASLARYLDRWPEVFPPRREITEAAHSPDRETPPDPAG